MSINSAMLAGVSGLVANSSAMAVISDNIANVNTTAFKRNRTDFTRLVNAQSAATTYNAGGVTASTRQLINNQGNINQTTIATDIAISGRGFFVVSPNATGIDGTNGVRFTRVGSFTPDAEGNLVNQSGMYLQGWPVADDGSVNTNPSDLSALETVNLNTIAGTVRASTQNAITGNLRATTPVSAAAAGMATAAPGAYNPATNNMASGAVRSDVPTWSFQVYDSQGSLRNFNVGFLKSATANQWHVEVWSDQPGVVVTGAPLVNDQIMTGTIAFTPDGRLDVANTSPALINPINFGAYNAGAPAAGAINWAPGTGVAAQTVALEIGQGVLGGITQLDSASTVTSTTTNGSVFGDLAGVEIDDEGFVTAQFNNGAVRRMYQLPIATFANSDGLGAEDGGVYRATGESGTYNLKQAKIGGAGEIASSALENSNVDLALEFSNMIITQRAYSASSKIITTADEMLDELIRMKR
jgi:flagellar hook protein FlgE